jgi:hypothetical protein
MNKLGEIIFGVPVIATVLFFFVVGILHCIHVGGFMGILATVLGGVSTVCIAVFFGASL